MKILPIVATFILGMSAFLTPSMAEDAQKYYVTVEIVNGDEVSGFSGPTSLNGYEYLDQSCQGYVKEIIKTARGEKLVPGKVCEGISSSVTITPLVTELDTVTVALDLQYSKIIKIDQSQGLGLPLVEHVKFNELLHTKLNTETEIGPKGSIDQIRIKVTKAGI